MRPAPVSFWKAGHVCLVWPKILVTRQRLGLSHLRAVLFTPLSGSISQQHCITLTGFPHLTERNLIRFLPHQPTKASHTLMPQLFFRPLYSFLPHLCCILCFGSIGTAKIKLRRGLFCLSGQNPLKAHSYMIFKVVVQASVAAWKLVSSKSSSNSFLAKFTVSLHTYVNMACVYCISWSTWGEIKNAEPWIY